MEEGKRDADIGRQSAMKQDLSSKKRWINYAVDHLRSSPITGICLELSTSSIASFKPGSIVLRSLSIFVDPSSSRVVNLNRVARFHVLFVDLRRIAGFPALFVDLRRIAGIPALFGFPALSVNLRRVAGFPALSSIVGLSQFPALSSIREIKPRSPASSISRVFRVFLLSSPSTLLDWSYRFPGSLISRVPIQTFLNLKLTSNLVMKKRTLTQKTESILKYYNILLEW